MVARRKLCDAFADALDYPGTSSKGEESTTTIAMNGITGSLEKGMYSPGGFVTKDARKQWGLPLRNITETNQSHLLLLRTDIHVIISIKSPLVSNLPWPPRSRHQCDKGK
ncbi:hypothetical protein MLD38_021431 [Melastoma candidum]|uniref:Uncharacterized protein n=1 Tax=Melastoma candidum TaxID=119954 RepID=A0ACB9QFB3_9MYRT|nr:hypothetical protein MLD38_021431 [Melastoma candidum]